MISDKRILELRELYINGPLSDGPLEDAHWITFARAVARESLVIPERIIQEIYVAASDYVEQSK